MSPTSGLGVDKGRSWDTHRPRLNDESIRHIRGEFGIVRHRHPQSTYNMSSREQIRQSCLISLRDVQGAEEIFMGKLEDRLGVFLNTFEPNFFAFVKEKLPNRSPERTSLSLPIAVYD